MQASKIAQSFPHHAGCFHDAAMRRAKPVRLRDDGLYILEDT
jgi:hypothetical protein